MNKKEREIFKQKVEQYPVIINRENSIDSKAQLLHFKDRVKDLDLNLIFGSDLSHSKYKNIHNDSLYLIGKQLQKPFYLGNSLEEVKQEIMADGEAEDYGPRYMQQYGSGILTNKKVGRTTAIYAHEEFDELPTDEDASTHQLPNGMKFVNLEKLLKNGDFFENPWVSSDRYDLFNHVYNGSKYGVIFIEDGEVAIHNLSKKELTTISNLEDYEFDPEYKKVSKDLAKVAPNAPDFSIDLGDPMSLDLSVIENDYYTPDKTIDDDRAKANIVFKTNFNCQRARMESKTRYLLLQS